MEIIEFKLHSEHIALCDLLKAAGLTGSGGAGKMLVANGDVRVDSQPENRKRAKIRAGQSVTCSGVTIVVTA